MLPECWVLLVCIRYGTEHFTYTHLTFMATAGMRRCYYPRFTKEVTEGTERLSTLPEAAMLEVAHPVDTVIHFLILPVL